MHFVLIFGPPAAGKMTVGRALADRTGYKLFHNHMSIEPVLGIFDFGSPAFGRITRELRRAVIAEAVEADLEGLIFTFVWGLDDAEDRAYLDHLLEPVVAAGVRLDFVELYADQETRVGREGSPDRVAAKPSKSDVEWARDHVIEMDRAGRLSSRPDEELGLPGHHWSFDNSGDDPRVTAEAIADALGLSRDRVG